MVKDLTTYAVIFICFPSPKTVTLTLYKNSKVTSFCCAFQNGTTENNTTLRTILHNRNVEKTVKKVFHSDDKRGKSIQ